MSVAFEFSRRPAFFFAVVQVDNIIRLDRCGFRAWRFWAVLCGVEAERVLWDVEADVEAGKVFIHLVIRGYHKVEFGGPVGDKGLRRFMKVECSCIRRY